MRNARSTIKVSFATDPAVNHQIHEKLERKAKSSNDINLKNDLPLHNCITIITTFLLSRAPIHNTLAKFVY